MRLAISDSNKKFFRLLFSLVIPLTLQHLLLSSLNFIDTIMIGQIGHEVLAAVAICNQVYLIVFIFSAGINAGASIFMGQFWGKRDIVGISRTFGITMINIVCIMTLLSLIIFLIPHQIMRLFTPDENVVTFGARYFRIVAFSYLFNGITLTYSTAARSTHNTYLHFFGSTIAIGLNIFLNWLLIFGNLGFPHMGIRGAALATIISRALEMAIIMGGIHFLKNPLTHWWRIYWHHRHHRPTPERTPTNHTPKKSFIRNFYHISIPLMLHELFSILGFSTYKIAYAYMSTENLAASAIVDTIVGFVFVFFFGVSNAGLIMMSNLIGAKKIPSTKIYAKKFLLISLLLGIFLGIILAVFSDAIALLYNVSLDVQRVTSNTMKTFLLLAPLRGMLSCIILSILRAGGDNKYAVSLNLSATYFVRIPLVFLSALVWQHSLPIVYLTTAVADIIAIAVSWPRIKRGRWIHHIA